MMTFSVTKNTVFSALLALVVILIAIRIKPIAIDENIKLVISKNRTSITSIYQPRDIERTKTVMVDRINLMVKNRFAHPKLGNIADASSDYFVDINHTMRVKKAGSYTFFIGTDDGFSLNINGELICEHLGDRPYTIQACTTQLTAGEQQFQLSYFQGYGNSGLTAHYAHGNGAQYWFGDNSKNIQFD